ncbi:MAG: hypothetical protein SWQ30_00555 [Thermodesulfobacteriota bacterium]|nr:hypothetical protein [Thermodesulfobacteriota bacterium]
MKGKTSKGLWIFAVMAILAFCWAMAPPAQADEDFKTTLHVILDHHITPNRVNIYNVPDKGYPIEYTRRHYRVGPPGNIGAGGITGWWDPNGDGRYDDALVLATFELLEPSNESFIDVIKADNDCSYQEVPQCSYGRIRVCNAQDLAGIVWYLDEDRFEGDRHWIFVIDRFTNHLIVIWDVELPDDNGVPLLTSYEPDSPKPRVLRSKQKIFCLEGILSEKVDACGHADGRHPDYYQNKGAVGLALDKKNHRLFVTDLTETVRYYNIADIRQHLEEYPQDYQLVGGEHRCLQQDCPCDVLNMAGSIDMTPDIPDAPLSERAKAIAASRKIRAISTAYDEENDIVYTGGGYRWDTYLRKYDMNPTSAYYGSASFADMAAMKPGAELMGAMGVLVDPATNLIYVTTGYGGDDLRIFDWTSHSEVEQVYRYPDKELMIRNPAGLCLGPPLEPPCTLTMEVDGVGTTVPPPGPHQCKCGDTVDICAVETDACWEFSHWSVDKGSPPADPNAKCTTVVCENKTVTAHFVRIKYTLTMVSDGCCPITPPPGDHEYYCGETVPIKADDTDPCCEFVKWIGAVADPSKPNTTVYMDSSKTVTAVCEPICCTLTMEVDGVGTTVPPPGPHQCKCGDTVDICAVETDACWEFSHWSVDKGSPPADPNAKCTTVVCENKTVTAHFVRIKYTLTMVSDGCCPITPPPGDHEYYCGETVPIKADDTDPCCEFVKWIGAVADPSKPNTTVYMDSNKTVTAVCVELGARLRLEKNGPAEVYPGDTITYKICVKNVGCSLASNVTLTDLLPNGTTFERQCSHPCWNYGQGTHTATCVIGDLQVGQEECRRLCVVVDSSTEPCNMLENCCTAQSEDGSDTDCTETHVAYPPQPPGNRPEFDAVGCDATNYFAVQDKIKQAVIANNIDAFGNPINYYSDFLEESFTTTGGDLLPDPCFPGHLSAMTDVWNEAIYQWDIVLQMKPESDIDLNIVDCVLDHDELDVWGGADQTGRYRAPWGELLFVRTGNPLITVEAIPGPYATPGFVEPFNLDARTHPGLLTVPMVEATYTSKAFWEEGIVLVMPESGATNGMGQTVFNLKDGDIIRVTIAMPSWNTVDVHYGQDNVMLKYIGIIGTEYLNDDPCGGP